jgi:hypothetical protein
MIKDRYHLRDSMIIVIFIFLFSFLFSFYSASGYEIFDGYKLFFWIIITSIFLTITFNISKKYLFKNCDNLFGLMNLLLVLTISEWIGFLIYMITTGAIIKHPDPLAFIIYLFYYIVSLIITLFTHLLVVKESRMRE